MRYPHLSNGLALQTMPQAMKTDAVALEWNGSSLSVASGLLFGVPSLFVCSGPGRNGAGQCRLTVE